MKVVAYILSSVVLRRAFLLLNVLCLSFWAKAQDIHFTQFTLQPLQQSPSLTGSFDGDYRIAALYRNQWASVAVPYNSMGLAFDTKIYETKKYGSFVGLGANLFLDQAGDGRLQSIYAQIPFSYNTYVPLNATSTLKFGLGAYLGILNKSIRTDQLQFDNQFNGYVYDANIPIAENFDKLNFIKPDIGLGYNVGFNFNKKFELGLAFGLHHLNRIEESFLGNNLHLALAKRISLPVYFKYSISDKWQLQADYLFQDQEVKKEHVFGFIASYFIKNKYPAQTAIEFGSYYRYKDAVCSIVRYRKNNFVAGLSYDINVSNLRPASNTYGGVELGLVYFIKNVKDPKIINKRSCFVF